MTTFIIYHYDNSTLLSFIKSLQKVISTRKRNYLVYCPICKSYFLSGKKTTKFCSRFCAKEYSRYEYLREKIKQNDILFANGIENYDYVKCPICGLKTHQLNAAHFEYIHHISYKLFKIAYPNQKITAEIYIKNNLRGDNNPMSKVNASEEKRKQCSPFAKEFYESRGISLEKRDKFMKKVNKTRSYTAKIDYYLNKGYSYEEAEKLRSERQRTFTLEKCIDKYGKEEGTRIWQDRQDKWKAKVFAEDSHISTGYSKVAMQFIEEILLNEENTEGLLYGKYEKCIYDKDFKTFNKYDLTNPKTMRIIEFNGDFWHMNPNIYKPDDVNKCFKLTAKEKWEIDRLKVEAAKKRGYEVLVIWENDYNKNHDEIIKICKEFIL